VPRYMLLLGGADLDKRCVKTELAQAMLDQCSAWVQSLVHAGRLRETYKLHDQIGARLSVRGGEVLEGHSSKRRTPLAEFSSSRQSPWRKPPRWHANRRCCTCRTATWRCGLSNGEDARALLELAVREHRPRLIAALTRRFGARHLELIDDAV